MSIKPKDVFGDWEVIKLGSFKYYGTRKRQKYFCKCTFNGCNAIKEVQGQSLSSGHSTGCGCRRYKKLTKHNGCETPLYVVFKGMRSRCNNKNHKGYANYGGRGIKLCKAWSGPNGFKNFKDWNESLPLEKQYKPYEVQIDRENNDKDYSPKNCRWISSLKNKQNMQNTLKIKVKGIEIAFSEYYQSFKNPGVSYNAARGRLSLGWPPKKCVVEPPKGLKNATRS